VTTILLLLLGSFLLVASAVFVDFFNNCLHQLLLELLRRLRSNAVISLRKSLKRKPNIT
jgi:hypothetical protein